MLERIVSLLYSALRGTTKEVGVNALQLWCRIPGELGVEQREAAVHIACTT